MLPRINSIVLQIEAGYRISIHHTTFAQTNQVERTVARRSDSSNGSAHLFVWRDARRNLQGTSSGGPIAKPYWFAINSYLLDTFNSDTGCITSEKVIYFSRVMLSYVLLLTWSIQMCVHHLCLFFLFVSSRLVGGPVGVSFGTNR